MIDSDPARNRGASTPGKAGGCDTQYDPCLISCAPQKKHPYCLLPGQVGLVGGAQHHHVASCMPMDMIRALNRLLTVSFDALRQD